MIKNIKPKPKNLKVYFKDQIIFSEGNTAENIWIIKNAIMGKIREVNLISNLHSKIITKYQRNSKINISKINRLFIKGISKLIFLRGKLKGILKANI